MKPYRILALALVLLALPGVLAAETPAALNLQKGDIKYVQIELKPGNPVRLNLYFTKAKLNEAQELIAANLDKPISITMEGKVVATPRIKYPLLYKNPFVALRFPDMDSAAKAAKLFVPSP